MAINVTLEQLGTLNNTSILAQSNVNFGIIETAFESALSTAAGAFPNQMNTNLDMNANQILNLPPPASINSPARLVDVTSPATIASVPPVGTSGAVVPLLNGNNTWSGTNTFNQALTFNSAINVAGVMTFTTGPQYNATPVFNSPSTFIGLASFFNNVVIQATGFAAGLFVHSDNTHNAEIFFQDNINTKWEIGKDGSSRFFIFDDIAGQNIITIPSGGGNLLLSPTNGIVQWTAGASFVPNASVTVGLGNVGPSGAHSTPVNWLQIADNGGTIRYIPCF